MKILVTENAKNDLDDIISYLEEHSGKEPAHKNFRKIKDKLQHLKDFPTAGRYVPELERISIFKYREVIVSPWRILYSIEKEVLYIMHIIDGRRNLEDILIRKIVSINKPG